MLVLTRRTNQELYLSLPSGERITIKLLGIKGNSIRLGIDAPRDVGVTRGGGTQCP